MWTIGGLVISKLVGAGIGIALAGIVVGGLLLSRNLKEEKSKDNQNDATPVEDCWLESKTEKEYQLCYLKNESGILRQEKEK